MNSEPGLPGRLRRRLRGQYIRILVTTHVTWLAIVFALGAWWAHVMMTQGAEIASLQAKLGIAPEVTARSLARIHRMVHWEAGTFFAILVAVTTFLLWLYLRDYRRARSIHAFFASLTHELRTPLTSIRLQAESIAETHGEGPAAPLISRLLEDTVRLEAEVERTLELARIEGGGPLFPQPLDLKPWAERFVRNWLETRRKAITIEVELPEDVTILADPGAIQVIFRNLFENTLRHAKTGSAEPRGKITGTLGPDGVEVSYTDNGEPTAKHAGLGQLFQKGPGSPGAGVGLYLIRALMERMGGHCTFAAGSGFGVQLHFRGGRSDA